VRDTAEIQKSFRLAILLFLQVMLPSGNGTKGSAEPLTSVSWSLTLLLVFASHITTDCCSTAYISCAPDSQALGIRTVHTGPTPGEDADAPQPVVMDVAPQDSGAARDDSTSVSGSEASQVRRCRTAVRI